MICNCVAVNPVLHKSSQIDTSYYTARFPFFCKARLLFGFELRSCTSLIYNMLHQLKRCLENRIKYHRGMWNVDGL